MMYKIHLSNEKLYIMDGHGWNDVIKVKSIDVDICDTNGFRLCELETHKCSKSVGQGFIY
jgi:hypothetical protein